jgi:DNA-binding PadR family transcriptional regulator
MQMSGRKGRYGWGYNPRGGFPMGPGPFFAGRPKVGRGDIRLAILQLLQEQPMHGYQIMQELTERSEGIWRPSPGSIYPTLQQLEDEGLVHSERLEGKNVYSLTEAGRDRLASEDQTPPWERLGEHAHEGLIELRDLAFQVGAAVMQVARSGSEQQLTKTREILEDARRSIYQLLGDDDAGPKG